MLIGVAVARQRVRCRIDRGAEDVALSPSLYISPCGPQKRIIAVKFKALRQLPAEVLRCENIEVKRSCHYRLVLIKRLLNAKCHLSQGHICLGSFRYLKSKIPFRFSMKQQLKDRKLQPAKSLRSFQSQSSSHVSFRYQSFRP